MLTQEYEAWTHSEQMEHSNPSPPLLHGSEGHRRACDANDTCDSSVKGLPVKKPETWGSCSQDPELGSWLLGPHHSLGLGLSPAAMWNRCTLLPGGQLMLEPFEILSLSDLARDQLWGTATGGLAGDSLLWIKSYRP